MIESGFGLFLSFFYPVACSLLVAYFLRRRVSNRYYWVFASVTGAFLINVFLFILVFFIAGTGDAILVVGALVILSFLQSLVLIGLGTFVLFIRMKLRSGNDD